MIDMTLPVLEAILAGFALIIVLAILGPWLQKR